MYRNRNGDEPDRKAANQIDGGSNGRAKKQLGNASGGRQMPLLFYREGETLRDLDKHLGPNGESRFVEVHIPASCMSSNNSQVRARQLWGSDVYTQDSDLVAVLMHTGYYSQALVQPPSAVAEVRATLKTLPAQKSYPSISRNCIRSRAWAAELQGCSYSVEKCWLVTRMGNHIELQPCLDGGVTMTPTFLPRQLERVMHTRSSASSSERRQRMMQDVTVQYNLVNEPWLKYSLMAIADHGLKPSQWTSAKLVKHALLVETSRERYEISLVESSAEGDAKGSMYRFAKCKTVMTLPMLQQVGVPLAPEYVEVVEPALYWEDFQWSPSGMHVKGKFYAILRLHFFRRSSNDSSS